MSLGTQSSLVMWTAVVLYFLAPAWVLWRGGSVLRAGLFMLAATFLPLLWQSWFTDSDAPGFGLLFMVMAPMPLLVIAIGLCIVLVRRITRTSTAPPSV